MATVTLRLRAGDGSTATKDVTINVEAPAASEWPVYRHSDRNATEHFGSLSTQWSNGGFIYYPGVWGYSDIRRSIYWDRIVAEQPGGLHTILSPKALNEANLKAFLDWLPQAWRDKMIVAYYQEPEDNFLTDTAIAGFRATVKRFGEIVRPYGVRNGVEIQSWSLSPNNTTYGPQGADNTPANREAFLAKFVTRADIDVISWSLYEKNLKWVNLDNAMNRMASFMSRYPGLAWDASATGIGVNSGTPIGHADRVLRADLTDRTIIRLKQLGASGFGWFDFMWTNGMDYQTETDSLLRNILISHK